MADYYSRACFAFSCAQAEMRLLEEAIAACSDLCGDFEPSPPSPALLAAFPPVDADPWSGLRAIFSDPDYPAVGADFTGGPLADAGICQVILSAEISLEPYDVAMLIQACCRETLASGPIGFEWASTCSRQRVGDFGGGWCAIFADRIEIENTGRALAQALAEGGG